MPWVGTAPFNRCKTRPITKWQYTDNIVEVCDCAVSSTWSMYSCVNMDDVILFTDRLS